MEENNNMTAERSLEIITEQIERSQRTITKNAALPLMWWGVCVIAFAPLIAYLWKNHGGPIWNTLWAVMWFIGFIGNWIIDKKKETVPSTFVIKTIDHVWSTFGLFCGSISIFFCLVGTGVLPLKLVIPNEYLFSCITSIISLCFGMSTSITGRIVKNRLRACGLDSDRLTAHSLRHTGITLALLHGSTLAEAQQMARHSSINTTMIYNHAIERANNQSEERTTAAIFGEGRAN